MTVFLTIGVIEVNYKELRRDQVHVMQDIVQKFNTLIQGYKEAE